MWGWPDFSVASGGWQDRKLGSAHEALVGMMDSWGGLFTLSHAPHCLNSLVATLRDPATLAAGKAALAMIRCSLNLEDDLFLPYLERLTRRKQYHPAVVHIAARWVALSLCVSRLCVAALFKR